MHLVESRSTRVLSTTDEEEHEEANDSNEHDTDTTTHKDIGEDTIDADDQADQSLDNASQNMVYDIYFFPFNMLLYLFIYF